jgi:hypothetical protein
MNMAKKPTRLMITAHHEAAHSVVLLRAAGHATNLSIIPDKAKGTLGHDQDSISDSSSPDHMAGEILSCYAGGHAQRQVDPACGAEGCETDEELAQKYLAMFGWQDRERELRKQSRKLVRQHWAEIVAVAQELLKCKTLDQWEVEIIADGAAGDPEAAALGDPEVVLAMYRAMGSDDPKALDQFEWVKSADGSQKIRRKTKK